MSDGIDQCLHLVGFVAFVAVRGHGSIAERSAVSASKPERVAVIDWTNPAANDFLLASQFWIESNLYKRRPDAVGLRHPFD